MINWSREHAPSLQTKAMVYQFVAQEKISMSFWDVIEVVVRDPCNVPMEERKRTIKSHLTNCPFKIKGKR
jgi:hypothetical protein